MLSVSNPDIEQKRPVELPSLWVLAESLLITHPGICWIKDSISQFLQTPDTGQDTKGKGEKWELSCWASDACALPGSFGALLRITPIPIESTYNCLIFQTRGHFTASAQSVYVLYNKRPNQQSRICYVNQCNPIPIDFTMSPFWWRSKLMFILSQQGQLYRITPIYKNTCIVLLLDRVFSPLIFHLNLRTLIAKVWQPRFGAWLGTWLARSYSLTSCCQHSRYWSMVDHC